jgi:radical SAM superfamily enzyme YgiQ (UPF0313 family)
MKIAIVYPPIFRDKKIPLLGQNRQFKFTHSRKIKIYPLVPAELATLLKKDGHNVLFLDGINLELRLDSFEKKLWDFNPDVVVLETKTPVIKFHWKYIDEIKSKNKNTICILVGDHCSAFPEESLNNSKVDYVIKGGDYDYIIYKLIKNFNTKENLPGGIYYKENGQIKNTGDVEFIKNLDELPFIDREITNWKIYGEAYLYRPCTYILTGRGCGREGSEIGGVCTFCVWQHLLWERKARLRSSANVAEEIEILVKKYKVYEIFDDNESGALWSIKWLEDFLIEIEKRNLKGRFKISSNARAENLTDEKCKLMKKIGYRLLKVGLESANQETLERIGKLESINEIKENIKRAKNYGFKILITTMVGYPWENEKDVKRTYEVTKELMLYKTHFGDSLQASIIMPYPGTPLYNYAKRNNLLTEYADDYDNYDMEHDILKSNIDTTNWCRKIWNIHTHPLFIIKSALSIRSLKDLELGIRGVSSLLGHTKDY